MRPREPSGGLPPSSPAPAGPGSGRPSSRAYTGGAAVKALAFLYIALGLAGLVAGSVTCVSFWLIPGRFSNIVLSFAAPIFLFLAIILFIPALVGGIGLLRGKAWGRIIILSFSGLMLLIFPIGTILGGFGLWALLHRPAHSVQPRLHDTAADTPRIPLNYAAATVPLLIALGAGVIVLAGIIVARLPQYRTIGDDTVAPEVSIVGFDHGWAKVRHARFADYGDGETVLLEGPGWISGKLLSGTLQAGLRARPDSLSALVAIGDPEAAVVEAIDDCSGAFAHVSVRLEEGRRISGWTNRLCANQVTTCA